MKTEANEGMGRERGKRGEEFDVRNTFIVFDYCQHMQFSCYGHGYRNLAIFYSDYVCPESSQNVCDVVYYAQQGNLSCLSLTSFRFRLFAQY